MYRTAGEALRFGTVGLLATAVHAIIYAGLIHFSAIPPQQANIAAFTFAFVFSYMGHSHFTFSGEGRRVGKTGPRFLAVALIGYALNAGFVFLTTALLDWGAGAALPFMIFITPAATFALSKYWAFRADGAEKLTRP